MEKLRQTPSQTVGPFFAYSLTAFQYGYDYNSIVNGSIIGDHTGGGQIYITGTIFDGNGKAIPDAMIELWQADTQGNYTTKYPGSPTPENQFRGFGRLGTGTDPDHQFCFKTVKPGPVNGQSPHINVTLFMRGSLRRLSTRMYFSDEINEEDALFSNVDATRRHTLIARRKENNGSIEYQFDIYLQGENETVFFDV
ncbi:MAG: protocatechuate 3,4-dioxygenase subunit alpha [Ferruginibacter sp.]